MELTAKEKHKKKVFDYEFSAVNYTDYELEIVMFTLNRILKLVFNKSQKSKVLKQNLGAKVTNIKNEIIDEVNEIIVAPQYYNLVNVGSKKTLGIVQDIVLKDGVFILNSEIEKIVFRRNKENKTIWEIHVYYKGNYRQE